MHAADCLDKLLSWLAACWQGSAAPRLTCSRPSAFSYFGLQGMNMSLAAEGVLPGDLQQPDMAYQPCKRLPDLRVVKAQWLVQASCRPRAGLVQASCRPCAGLVQARSLK
jgi:hypothetical protein